MPKSSVWVISEQTCFLVMMEDSGTTYTCSVLAVEVEANISPSEGNNISDIGCRAKTHWI